MDYSLELPRRNSQDSIESSCDSLSSGESTMSKRTPSSAPNPAINALRYKTRLCRNWRKNGRCPYGPRCLYAHGTRQQRSEQLNLAAIDHARSAGPDMQATLLQYFPDKVFVPATPVPDSQYATEQTVFVHNPYA
eukprot:NODE_6129_length_656_cov_126.657845_g6106_i0.p1 GENE.NODE_6129_length_656_cov_126.657845_g6106_i0~~NODE_6129_length_656_cov_126.657845_g6106_i0.p1  ORF type:complete len:135 (-),score=25.35 NODE_6129_length_656_cov_126.657845_g6106_i0:174-578(-)